MSPDSDEVLIQHWRAGEASALDTLVDRYLCQFYGTARAMLFVEADAEDVAHDAMVKVMRTLNRFDSRASFRTWSYTILLNTIRDAQRRNRMHLPGISVPLPLDAPQQQDPIQPKASSEQLTGDIGAALAKLSEKQRTALVLMVMEGFTGAQVAELENCSVDAVYQRVAEARRVLREDASLKELWYD